MKIYHTVWHKEQTVLLIPIRSPVKNYSEFLRILGNYETYWSNIKYKIQDACNDTSNRGRLCMVTMIITTPQPPKKLTIRQLRKVTYSLDLNDYSLISEITGPVKVYDYIDFLGSYDISGPIFPDVSNIPKFSEFIQKGYNLSKTIFPIIYLINYLYDTGRIS